MNRWRLFVAEALVWLVLARLLISGLRFSMWRHWLGTIDAGHSGGVANQADRNMAHAVERATARLPGGAKCLPRAMALHWMLRRRGRPSELVIAKLASSRKGALEDLHAWVSIGEETLIGQLDLPYHALVRFC